MKAAVVQAKMAAAPRRGLSHLEAAIYVGVSPSTFQALVAEGKMPTARLIGGRNVWDIKALDAAFDDLPAKGGGSWGDM